MQKTGNQRLNRKLTRAEQRRLAAVRKKIAAELPELCARDQMAKDAMQEKTLSGQLRRAVHASDLSLSAIALNTGITPLLLDEFLTGERTLRSDVMDRLAACLGLGVARIRK